MRVSSLLEMAGPEVKISPVSVKDAYKGELFGEKVLYVDGEPKVIADINIVGGFFYIQNIRTADDARRKGYAMMLVDDLFKETKGEPIKLSMMTQDGTEFFRHYPQRDGHIFPRDSSPPEDWAEEVIVI